jgi:hypothetical protein
MDFDPNSFAAQADNSTLSAFTDPASGTTFDTTGAPKYRVLSGGQAGVDFDGTGADRINIGRAAALSGALEGGYYTIIAILENIQTTIAGGYISVGAQGDPHNVHMTANGRQIGRAGGQTKNMASWSSTATVFSGITINNNRQRTYMQGGCVTSSFATAPGVTTHDYCIGGKTDGYSILAFKGRIRRLLIYSGVASPSDMLAVREWATRAGYFAANPWDSMPAGYKFTIFDGSSLMVGEGAGNSDNTPASRYKTAKGLDYGQYTMVALGGYNLDEISAKLPEEIGRVSGIIGGLDTRVAFFEYYNSRGRAALLTDSVSLIAEYQEAGVPVAFCTSTDSKNETVYTVTRAQYNAFDWDGTPASTGTPDPATGKGGADAQVNVHLSSEIGVEGSAPATGSNTYFTNDGLHLTDAGSGILEALIRPAIDSV